jgi:hypothetical protein
MSVRKKGAPDTGSVGSRMNRSLHHMGREDPKGCPHTELVMSFTRLCKRHLQMSVLGLGTWLSQPSGTLCPCALRRGGGSCFCQGQENHGQMCYPTATACSPVHSLGYLIVFRGSFCTVCGWRCLSPTGCHSSHWGHGCFIKVSSPSLVSWWPPSVPLRASLGSPGSHCMHFHSSYDGIP